MEKILKLIKSPCRDDLEIGVALFLALPFEEISTFFKVNGSKVREGHTDILTRHIKFRGPYIDLGNNYLFIHFNIWLRLKNRKCNSINRELPIISLKEYLYGEDI